MGSRGDAAPIELPDAYQRANDNDLLFNIHPKFSPEINKLIIFFYCN